MQILWQCGSLYYEAYHDCKSAMMEHVYIKDFIEDMNLAYTVADLIVCRAGALTIAEVQLLGKAALLIPSPNVAEDHQTKNAQALVRKSAAVMIDDKLISKNLIQSMKNLLSDEDQLEKIKCNAMKMARPNATQLIVNEVEALIEN